MRKETIGNCTLFLGDCLESIKTITDKSFDAIITDPPYKQEAHGRGICSKRPKVYAAMAEYTSLSVDFFESEDLFNEFIRVCIFPNFFIFCGKREKRNLMNLAFDNGLHYTDIPLLKRNPTPFLNNTWLSKEESLHICSKKLTYCKEYRLKLPYFWGDQNKETEHPNEKPLNVIKSIMQNITLPEQVIFDLFMGSGTTAVACMQMKRKFVGCEINEKYFDVACERIESASKQGTLFDGGWGW